MPKLKRADVPRNRVADYDRALLAFAEAADALEQAKRNGDLSSVEQSALDLRAARQLNRAASSANQTPADEGTA